MFATVVALFKMIRSASEEVTSNGRRQDTTELRQKGSNEALLSSTIGFSPHNEAVVYH